MKPHYWQMRHKRIYLNQDDESRAMIHETLIRVYYEDTDAMGIVYYANYLRFFERARTEFLRAGGFEKSGSDVNGSDEKQAFVVRRCDIRFLKPAYHDDLLRIESQLLAPQNGKKPLTIDMAQNIYRDNDKKSELLVRFRVNLALVNQNGKVATLPDNLWQYFTQKQL